MSHAVPWRLPEWTLCRLLSHQIACFEWPLSSNHSGFSLSLILHQASWLRQQGRTFQTSLALDPWRGLLEWSQQKGCSSRATDWEAPLPCLKTQWVKHQSPEVLTLRYDRRFMGVQKLSSLSSKEMNASSTCIEDQWPTSPIPLKED